MASVNIQKVKSGQCVGLMRHDFRVGKNHTNEHIDSSIENHNLLSVGEGANRHEQTYEDAHKRYKECLKYLDSVEGQNKRKDRVEVLAINVPSPENATREQQKTFFMKVTRYLITRFNPNTCISAIVHYDEVHNYSKTGKDGQIEHIESRPHLHYKTFAIDSNGKFNAKVLTSRKNLLEIQKDIDGIAKDMGLIFHTNEKTKSKKTVESLKNESKALEDLELEIFNRECDLNNVDNEIEYKKEQLEEIGKELETNVAALALMQPTKQDLALLKLDEEIEEEIKQLKHELGYEGCFDSKRGFRYISEETAIGLNSLSEQTEELSKAHGALSILETLKKKLEPIIYAIKLKLGIIKPPQTQRKTDLKSSPKPKRYDGPSL